jgi:hypothetical protein
MISLRVVCVSAGIEGLEIFELLQAKRDSADMQHSSGNSICILFNLNRLKLEGKRNCGGYRLREALQYLLPYWTIDFVKQFFLSHSLASTWRKP